MITVRIRDTYWEFTDAKGKIKTHRGPAFRGEDDAKPVPRDATITIKPGGAYRGPYTIGFVVLQTATANAEGFFTVEVRRKTRVIRLLQSCSG